MKKLLLLGILTTLMSACATSPQFKFNVKSKTITDGLPEKHNCIVLYDNEDEKTIEGKFYIPQLEAMLKSKGIYIVKNQNESFNCVISVTHNTSYGKEQEVGYTYGQTGVSSSTSYTNYGYGYGTTYTNYIPTYGITGTYTYDVPIMYNIFSMIAVDAKKKEEIWKIHVFYAGSTKDKWEQLFQLFNCILSKYLFVNYDNNVVLSKEDLIKIYDGQCSFMWDNKIFKEIKHKAFMNYDAESSYQLAQSYLFGIGTDKNIKESLYWARIAALKGHSEAQLFLGSLYLNEGGDKESAFYWFSQAAKQGSKDLRRFGKDYIKDIANSRIADMYYSGEGTEQDFKKAMEIYSSLPSFDNFPIAEARLSCYDESINTAQQHFEKCLTMAKQGNVKAQYAVARAYYEGIDIEKDKNQAYNWLLKAAKQDSKYEQIMKEVFSEVKDNK